jgi:uncharacterized hydrophobic protein (TIGR00271 family)
MRANTLDFASPAAWWRWLRMWRQNELVEKCQRVEVLTHVDEAGRLGPRYTFMTIMSCGIAMLGLLQNSVAVIIGAMLISPLMGPIVELGMGLATFDFRTVRESLRTLAVGVAVSLLTAVLIVSASPLQDATPEILARTQPTLFDLLVAVFSGLAGAYATVTRKGETIVGVAIATALMPPLAVVGYGIAVGNANVAGGAGFLFMTNLLAIALSVTMVARLYGFGGSDSPKQTAWQASLIIGVFLLLSIPLGIALRDIAGRGLVERTVRQELDERALKANGRINGLRVNANVNPVQVDAVLMVPKHVSALPQQVEKALEAKLARPVDVQIREVLLQDDAQVALQASSLAELRNSVAQLQDAAARQTQARALRDGARDAARDALLAQLGRIEVLDDGRQRLLLDPAAALSLDAAWRLQPPRTESAAEPLEVVPAVQPLPDIVFADDSAAADAAMRARIETAAWAAQRWRVGTLRVTGFGGTPALAKARADAVAAALATHGVRTEVRVADREALRLHVQEHGSVAARSVRLEAAATAP